MPTSRNISMRSPSCPSKKSYKSQFRQKNFGRFALTQLLAYAITHQTWSRCLLAWGSLAYLRQA
jgi:hypothetical protein